MVSAAAVATMLDVLGRGGLCDTTFGSPLSQGKRRIVGNPASVGKRGKLLAVAKFLHSPWDARPWLSTPTG